MIKHYALLLAVALGSMVHAQTNQTRYVFNGAVNSIVHSSDGSTYVGGSFTSLTANSGRGVIMDANTGAWNQAGANVEYGVTCAVTIPVNFGGGWYIGGGFTTIDGQVRKYLARINADGTLHPFNPDLNETVSSLALDANGNLYVGGRFSTIGTITRNRLAKFDNTGVLTNFNPNMSGGNTGVVSALAFDEKGNLFAGGEFTSVGGIVRKGLAKFDTLGVLTSFNPNINGGSLPSVLAIAFDASGNLFVGGDFTKVGVITRNRLAQFDSTGVLTSFNPNMNNYVYALAVGASGNLYAGGFFTSVSGTTRNRLAKIDTAGVLMSFNPNMNGTVNALALDSSENLYAGGNFYTVGGTTQNHIAKFDTAGVLSSFNPIMNSSVDAIALDSGGKMFVGGLFTTIGGTIPRNRLAKLDAAGVLTSFNPNLNNVVHALGLDASGNLYAGGEFTKVGTINRSRLAKFDSAGVLSSFYAGNINNHVRSLALDASGNVYVGGQFTSMGGTSRNRLAKIDNTGVLTSFNPNLNNTVLAIALDASGNLYAGGEFTTAGGSTTRNRLAKFDNAGVLLSLDPNMNGVVNAIAVDTSGNLFAGGGFTSVGGSTTRNRLVKFDSAGTLTSFNPDMNNEVNALAVDSSGNLFMGGNFTTVGGLTFRNRIAIFDNAGVLTSFNPNLVGGAVLALDYDLSGHVYVGGSFTETYAVFCATAPTISSTTSAAICGAGTVTLQATASSGAVIKWYTDSIGGIPLFVGTSFTTPSLSTTTTYFAEADNGGCLNGIRIPVAATIGTTTPSAPTGAASQSFCTLATVADLSATGTEITWYNASTGGGLLLATDTLTTATHYYASQTINGCESTTRLDVFVAINNAKTGTDIQTACNTFTWIDGNTYTASNNTATFNILGGAANSCDSLVTLDLTVINSAIGTDVQTACNTFTWIDGSTYTANNNSATFNIVAGAANGCDSLVTLDLTIKNDVAGVDIQTACNSFNWLDGNTYTTNNNTATFNIVDGAANGCDSLVTLDLTINTVDTSLTSNSPMLTSNASAASYQWLDCNNGFAPISGETNQSFIATVNGNYAVEVSQNGCSDTSACMAVNNIGLEALQENTHNLRIYPNPSTGIFVVEYDFNEPVQIEVFTIHGKLILKTEITQNSNTINISEQPAGMYLINVSLEESLKSTRKVIVY